MPGAPTRNTFAPPIDYSDDDEPILPIATPQRSSMSPIMDRSSIDSSQHYPPRQRPPTTLQKWTQTGQKFQRQAIKKWNQCTPAQRVGLVALNVFLLVLMILSIIYGERIFVYLGPAAKSWREMRAGWLIMWMITFVVAFPPLIGYSTSLTISGFVFGMKGWFIVSTASVAGSTCAFIVSRTFLRGYVNKLTEKNKEFAALSLVLKYDGLGLLTMIRLCPLPYSIANGAISTIPTVTWQQFMLATAFATPKLLLHCFVGSRLSAIAENGDKMDTKTKIINYLGVIFGMGLGFATGYVIYVRTKARARALEAEEAAAANNGPRTTNAGTDYIDDPNERAAVDALRRDDNIPLHDPYEDEDEDESTDGRDAKNHDVFDDGDGSEDAGGRRNGEV